MAVGAPFAPFALSATAPGGALARAALLARSPSGRFDLQGLGERIDDLGVRFDGRLRVVAVDRARGRRVVFGEPVVAGRQRGGGRRGVLCRTGSIQADHDRKSHLRRRRRVESHQPRPGAGRPRDAGAVPDADRRCRRDALADVSVASDLPLGDDDRAGSAETARRDRERDCSRPRLGARDGGGPDEPEALRSRAGRRLPPGTGVRSSEASVYSSTGG